MDKKIFDIWITTPVQEKTSYGLERLTLLIKNTCLRRTKKLTEFSYQLPNRREQTVLVELSQGDRDLYTFFEREAAKIASGFYRHNVENSTSNHSKNNILKMINFLRLICDHGEKLLPQSAIDTWLAAGDKAIGWQKIWESQESCEICGLKIDGFQDQSVSRLDISFPQVICRSCLAITEESEPRSGSTNFSRSIPTPDGATGELDSTIRIPTDQQSSKLKALIDNLRQEQSCSDQYSPNQPIKR
jgi:SNF2 family DNA or RNA helicase